MHLVSINFLEKFLNKIGILPSSESLHAYARSYAQFIRLNPLNILNIIARLLLRMLLGEKRKKSTIYERFLIWHSSDLFFFNVKKAIKQKKLILNTDWRLLIVLDACRYDYFKERLNEFGLKGKLTAVRSEGSNTIQWAKKTFNQKYNDIIYVSSSPFISQHSFLGWRGVDHFFHIENVWDYGFKLIDGVWTVSPKEVCEASKRLLKRYPEKRLIVHFMQPHTPYLGRMLPKFTEKQIINYEKKILKLVRKGVISRKEIRTAYKENLRIVLRHVLKLITETRGEVVITSDHGEYLGSILLWHSSPYTLHLPELVIVPWFEVDRTHHDRKHVKFASRDVGIKEEKETHTQEEEERVKQRLKALGYL